MSIEEVLAVIKAFFEALKNIIDALRGTKSEETESEA